MEVVRHRQITARRQFKALVRLAYANREWLVDSSDYRKGAHLKNIHVMATKKQTPKSILKLKDKALLNKPAELRTDEEKTLLYRLFGGIICFRKYPPHVQLLLAGSAYFAYYGPDRVIVRQNHRAEAMYFILSGEVNAFVDTYDSILNENVTTISDILTAGNSFGEISLLNDVPRPNTIVTKTSVELLILKREDFNIILKESVRKEWDYITAALNGFSYFDNWDDVTKTECCLVSRLRQFQKNQTILGDNVGLKSWVHFVLKGECKLIQDISVKKTDTTKGTSYKLFEVQPLTSSRMSHMGQKTTLMSISDMIAHSKSQEMGLNMLRTNERRIAFNAFSTKLVDVHFMQVCKFTEKACFGLGENMSRRRIIADTANVECLLIPLYWLTYKGKNSRTWSRIQSYLETHIPSSKELLKEYVEQKKWREHKKKLMKEKMKTQPCNVFSSIPYSIRIREDFEYMEASQ